MPASTSSPPTSTKSTHRSHRADTARQGRCVVVVRRIRLAFKWTEVAVAEETVGLYAKYHAIVFERLSLPLSVHTMGLPSFRILVPCRESSGCSDLPMRAPIGALGHRGVEPRTGGCLKKEQNHEAHVDDECTARHR